MASANVADRAGGGVLAVASLLMVVGLVLHGPIAPELADQMTRIAGNALRWSIAHWMAAAALSLYAMSGLIMLAGRSHLTATAWTLVAWAVLPVGALWTLTTAVAEATVITDAALAGDTATFMSWWAFAEGMASGFVFLALAVAVIAGAETRRADPATPPAAAWAGAIAGLASFAGWALGMWLGVRIGNLLWVVSSVLMSLWTLWFGVSLARTAGVRGAGRLT